MLKVCAFLNKIVAFIKRNAPVIKISACVLVVFLALFSGYKLVAAIAAALGSLVIGSSAVYNADTEQAERDIERAQTVSDEIEERQKQRRKEADELREGLDGS